MSKRIRKFLVRPKRTGPRFGSNSNQAPSRAGIGGPATPEGKARSSQNALKHGFTSKTPHLLPNESSEVWTLHHNRYIAELRPANILETDLVRDLASSRRVCPPAHFGLS